MENNNGNRSTYQDQAGTEERRQRNKSWDDRSNDWNNRNRDLNERDFNEHRNRNYNYESGGNVNQNYGQYGNRNAGDWDNENDRNYEGYTSGDYNRSGNKDYNRSNYSNNENYNRNRNNNPNDRNWWDRTADEVSSWFGDDDAKRRRRMDELNGPHRGKGPKGYMRSDDKIRDDINDKLYHDSYVDASDIEVTVKDGDVTLSGTVDSRDTKRRAEDLAEGVTGVKDVSNNLKINRTISGQTTDQGGIKGKWN